MKFPEAGIIAPDFVTKNDTGLDVKLSDYRGKKVVLYFYPKADTPGCTIQACRFRDNYGAFQERDVTVLGVSIDSSEEQAAFKTKYALPFTLLADPNHEIAELYGIWGHHKFTRSTGEEIEYNGLRRSTLILDETGMVLTARWGVDPANDTEEILAILDGKNG